MTANEYQKAAMRTFDHNGSATDALSEGLMGLCGEAGESIDLFKKHMFQGHKLEHERIAEELGDVAWYLAISANAIGYDLDTILRMNIEKLERRYPDGFDAEHSVNRCEVMEGYAKSENKSMDILEEVGEMVVKKTGKR